MAAGLEREEKNVLRSTALAGLVLAFAATAALADPIEGTWKTKSGSTAAIASCGDAYCITLKSGEYAGKQIGRLSGNDGSYAGKITDPKSDKTYSGKAAISGSAMSLKGCVFGGLICRGETWTKM